MRDGVKREKAHTLHISRRAVVTIMVSRRVFFTLVFFALVARRDADAARPLTEGIDARSLAELEDIVHPTVIWSEIEPLSPVPTRQRDRVVVSAASGVGDVVVAAAPHRRRNVTRRPEKTPRNRAREKRRASVEER